MCKDCTIGKLQAENAELKASLSLAEKQWEEYRNQYHLCEAKLLSHKAIIRQLPASTYPDSGGTEKLRQNEVKQG